MLWLQAKPRFCTMLPPLLFDKFSSFSCCHGESSTKTQLKNPDFWDLNFPFHTYLFDDIEAIQGNLTAILWNAKFSKKVSKFSSCESSRHENDNRSKRLTTNKNRRDVNLRQKRQPSSMKNVATSPNNFAKNWLTDTISLSQVWARRVIF